MSEYIPKPPRIFEDFTTHVFISATGTRLQGMFGKLPRPELVEAAMPDAEPWVQIDITVKHARGQGVLSVYYRGEEVRREQFDGTWREVKLLPSQLSMIDAAFRDFADRVLGA
jgi:hypothetical protein